MSALVLLVLETYCSLIIYLEDFDKFHDFILELLHTSTEMLGMNQNEEYRATQEERLQCNAILKAN